MPQVLGFQAWATVPVYVVPEFGPRTLCMIGKQSTN